VSILVRFRSCRATWSSLSQFWLRLRQSDFAVAASCRVALGVACGFTSAVAAVPVVRPPPTDPAPSASILRSTPAIAAARTGAEAPRPGHETEAQTIAKCLKDLGSPDPEVRRRAVLILGKYRASAARQAVAGRLEDKSAAVRQAALVSLSEGGVLPPGVVGRIVRLLLDPDIHIRRIASSALRRCFSPRQLMIRSLGAPVSVSLPTEALPPTDMKEILSKTLRAPDPIIRKNLLALSGYLGKYFDPVALRMCLKDRDREVRVLALQACARVLPAKELPSVLFPAAQSGDPEVRKAAVRLLPRLLPASLDLLKKLAGDADIGVRTEAVNALAWTRNPAVFPLIQRFLEDDRVPASERARVVTVLIVWPRTVIPFLTRLAETAPPPLRAGALRALGVLGRKGGSGPVAGVSVRLFVEELKSSSTEVRKAAAMAILRRAGELKEADLAAMTRSRFVDVRLLAVQTIGRVPADVAREVLSDLILDDDMGVRCRAVREMALRRVGDWQFVLAESLRDPEAAVQKAAADALLARRDPMSTKLLSDYLQKSPDSALAEYIRARLGTPGPRRRPARSTRPARP